MSKRDVVEQRARADARARLEVLDRQQHLVGDRRRPRCSGEGSSEPTISSASWRAVTSVGSTVADRRAAADHGDLVGDGEHLVELVGDEDDREALLLQLAQVAEQLVDLLRHQHRGRLVEDDDPGTAVEHLEDLHPLPGTDAELLDQPVGLDAEPVGVGDAHDLGSRAPPPMPCSFSAPSTTFSRTVKLSASMKCWNTMPTPALIASAGECSVTSVAVDLDRARVRRLHAVEDLHQRRLAGAVLADDRVDGAAPDVDVDVVVGDHAGEALADPAQAHGDGRPASVAPSTVGADAGRSSAGHVASIGRSAGHYPTGAGTP